LIGLIFTALLLIVQVERHFNAIWGMPKKNHFLHKPIEQSVGRPPSSKRACSVSLVKIIFNPAR